MLAADGFGLGQAICRSSDADVRTQELSSFLAIETMDELVVDRSAHGDLLRINFNISFPSLSCEFATLDVSDALGTVSCYPANSSLFCFLLQPLFGPISSRILCVPRLPSQGMNVVVNAAGLECPPTVGWNLTNQLVKYSGRVGRVSHLTNEGAHAEADEPDKDDQKVTNR